MGNNIFGGGDKLPDEFKEKVDTHSKALLTVVQQQKDIESNIDLIDEKIELLDHNAIKNFKKIFDQLKDVKAQIRSLKEDMNVLKEFNSKVTKQMKLFASKDEVTKLERYIDLWNPMDFVTRDEFKEHHSDLKKSLEKIVEEFLADDFVVSNSKFKKK